MADSAMNQSTQRRHLRPWLLGAFVVLVFAGAILVACSGKSSSSSQAGSSTPAGPITINFNNGAVTGKAPPLIPVNNQWTAFSADSLFISCKYPQTWQMVRSTDGTEVMLYPPGYHPGSPAPFPSITFTFDPSTQYKAGVVNAWDPTEVTTPQAITISGITGQQYEDKAFVVPMQSSYIELPDHGGLLTISATKGPSTNLVPQLDEILKTLTLQYKITLMARRNAGDKQA